MDSRGYTVDGGTALVLSDEHVRSFRLPEDRSLAEASGDLPRFLARPVVA
jgi:hypothetical protein